MSRLACHHNVGTQARRAAGTHDIGHETQSDLELGMTHLLAAWHADIIGRLGQGRQSGNQLL